MAAPQKLNEAAFISSGQNMLKSKIAKAKSQVPCPVFDHFLQAFVITRNDQSFYLDLNGVYDFNFLKIQWSNKVIKIQVASPYLIGFLQNSHIEVRNIFNPNKIYQKIELEPCTFIQTAVSRNLEQRFEGRLDDFCIIIKSMDQLDSHP